MTSASVGRGEDLGVAGVAGAAQPVLRQTGRGRSRPTHGRIVLDGTDITGRCATAARLKLAYIPDERAAGLVPAFTVATNASLLRLRARFSSRRAPALRQEIRYGGEITIALRVRPPAPGCARAVCPEEISKSFCSARA